MEDVSKVYGSLGSFLRGSLEGPWKVFGLPGHSRPFPPWALGGFPRSPLTRMRPPLTLFAAKYFELRGGVDDCAVDHFLHPPLLSLITNRINFLLPIDRQASRMVGLLGIPYSSILATAWLCWGYSIGRLDSLRAIILLFSPLPLWIQYTCTSIGPSQLQQHRWSMLQWQLGEFIGSDPCSFACCVHVSTGGMS